MMAVTTQSQEDSTTGSGVEREIDEEGLTQRVRPYDATKIRISTKTWSLRQVIDDINDKAIDLVPDFQRAYVWKEQQQSRLIESILLGVPLPSFYFSADETSTMQVVDGVQRLTTIDNYYNNSFPLNGLEYLTELHTRRFDALDAVWKRRFQQTQIQVHVIEPQTPAELKFDIFRRLNTGGTPLTSQQIRHCISKPRSRTLLQRMVRGEAFRRATRNVFDSDPEMTAQELALRFIALRTFNRADYNRFDRLDDFLIDVTRRLDDEKAVGNTELITIQTDFDAAMRRAWTVFETKAFRRWPTSTTHAGPLNRALFDSWSVVLAEVDDETVEQRRTEILAAARRAMDSDDQYVRSFTVATGDGSRIELRLRKAREIARGGVQ